MKKLHDSSALAKQVAEKMGMDQKTGMELYKELSQISNGHVKDILDELTAPEKKQEEANQKYVAVIKASCTQDVRHMTGAGLNPVDEDSWRCPGKIPLFIGIVEASTPVRAMHQAAAQAGVDASVIELISI